MTTTIRLTGIESWGRYGVTAQEKAAAQPLLIDVECELARASTADDLATTTDYAALAARVAQVAAAEPYDLIETVALRIATMCLAEEFVTRTSVTVHKPQAKMPVPVSNVAVNVQIAREAT